MYAGLKFVRLPGIWVIVSQYWLIVMDNIFVQLKFSKMNVIH